MLEDKNMSEDVENYYVFAEDHRIYGPARSELLQQWAKNGLISMETWIYHEKVNLWNKAKEIFVLNGLLAVPTLIPEASRSAVGLHGGQLRRIRLFADMTNEQAESFVSLLKKVKIPPFATIVKQGEHGDSMFLLLEGEARVTVNIQGKEDMIAVLGVGDFFGEIALLDQGPRSANVIANKNCTLLQLSKDNFEQIVQEQPELASRFLIAMNRFLGSRIRTTNERFSKAQNLSRSMLGQIVPPIPIKPKI